MSFNRRTRNVRLISSQFGKKEELFGLIEDITREESEERLRAEKPGYCVLRLDTEGSRTDHKKATATIFHKNLSVKLEKVTRRDDEILVKVDAKNFRYVKTNLVAFSQVLMRFVRNMVTNKNWVEKELVTDELERELSFREFVIYPSRDHIVIMKRNRTQQANSQRKSISIVISVDKCQFLVLLGQTIDNSQNDFNQILLKFLVIDPKKTFIAKQMLGYDVEKLNKELDREENSLSKKLAISGPIRMYGSVVTDKKALLSALVLLLDSFFENPEIREDVTEGLQIIKQSLSVGTEANAERLAWIKNGIFPVLLKIFAESEKHEMKEMVEFAVEIVKLILDKNPEGANTFCTAFWEHLEKEKNDAVACLGLCRGLNELFAIESLPAIFLRRSAVSTFVSLYKRSRALDREKLLIDLPFIPMHDPASSMQSMINECWSSKGKASLSKSSSRESKSKLPKKSSGKATNPSSTIVPLSASNRLMSTSQSDSDETSEGPTSRIDYSMIKSVTRPSFVPPAPLADREEKVKAVPVYVKKKRSQLEEFKHLGWRMGESLISSDLTVLLNFKYESDRRRETRQSRKSWFLTPTPVLKEAELPKDSKSEPAQDKLRLQILRLLSCTSAIGADKQPVNLLFEEMIYSYRNLRQDKEARSLMQEILGNFSESLEFQHRVKWERMTKETPEEIIPHFRRKLDLVAFRINGRLTSAIDHDDLETISVLLTVLVDYTKHSKTRVMAAQIVDTCMDNLLKIFYWIVRQKCTTDQYLQHVTVVYPLIQIFDLIADQNQFPPLNDFLLTILVHKDTPFMYIRHYAENVLGNDTTFTKKVVSVHGEEYLHELRVSILRHYKICACMVLKEYGSSEEATKAAIATKLGLVKKLDFLTYPDAIVQQLLANPKTSFEIQTVCLSFIHKLLTIREKEHPLLGNEYVDSYISFHYLHFLRTYHSYSIEPQSLKMCRKHMRILIDFATQKNEGIRMKFYQLRVMHFLTQEINLEYAVQVRSKSSLQSHGSTSSLTGIQSNSNLNPGSAASITSATKSQPATETKIPPTTLSVGSKKMDSALRPAKPDTTGATSKGDTPEPATVRKARPTPTNSRKGSTKKGSKVASPIPKKTVPSGGKTIPPKMGAIGLPSLKNVPLRTGELKKEGGSIEVKKDKEDGSTNSDSSDSERSSESVEPTPKKPAIGKGFTLPSLKNVPLRTGDVKKEGAKIEVEKDRESERSSDSSSEANESREPTKPAMKGFVLPSLKNVPLRTGDVKQKGGAIAIEKVGSSSTSSDDSGSDSDDSDTSSSAETPRKPAGKGSTRTVPLRTGDVKQEGGIIEAKKAETSTSSKDSIDNESDSESTSESVEKAPKGFGKGFALPSLKNVPLRTGDVKTEGGKIKVDKEVAESSSASSISDSSEEVKAGFALPSLKNVPLKTGDVKQEGGKIKVEKEVAKSSSTESSSSSESYEVPQKKLGFALPSLKNVPLRTGDVKHEGGKIEVEKEDSIESSTTDSSSSHESTPASSSSEESDGAPKKPVGFTLPSLKNVPLRTGEVKGEGGKIGVEKDAESEPEATFESSDESETSSSEAILKPAAKAFALPSLKNVPLRTGEVKDEGGKIAVEKTDKIESESAPSEDSSTTSESSDLSRSDSSETEGKKIRASSESDSDTDSTTDSSTSSRSTSSSNDSSSSDSSSEGVPKKKLVLLPVLKNIPLKTGEVKAQGATGSDDSSDSTSASSDSDSYEEAPKKFVPLLKNVPLKTGEIKANAKVDPKKLVSSSSDSSDDSESTDSSDSSSEEAPKKPAFAGLSLKNVPLKTGGVKNTAPVASKATPMQAKKAESPEKKSGSPHTKPKTGSKASTPPNSNVGSPTTKKARPHITDSSHAIKTPPPKMDTAKTSTTSTTETIPSNSKPDTPSVPNSNESPTVVVDAKTLEEERKAKEDERWQRIIDSMYASERHARKVYADDKLHVAFLELIMNLLLSLNGYRLETYYTNQFPMRVLKLNVFHILMFHLNHPMNAPILGPLQTRAHQTHESVFLILKMLTKRFFQPQMLSGFSAFGAVYGCKLLGKDVAVKHINISKNITDRSVPHDIFTEILILDKWKSDARICKLIDYGVDDNFYWIIMKKYRMSLRSWRIKQTKSISENILLYLNIYSDILNVSRFFKENGTNHYDLKCDNFLVDPFDSQLSNEDLYSQTGDKPNFTVCIADFGESLVYTNPTEGFTLDSRGTEFIKSPEMLTVAHAKHVDKPNYDRLKPAGEASDIWSLACVLYELLTGIFLFYDDDWVRFFVRVTKEREKIPEKRRELIAEYPEIISFLNWILNPDPHRRPHIYEAIIRFQSMREKVTERVMQQREERDREEKEEREKEEKEKEDLEKVEDEREEKDEVEEEVSIIPTAVIAATPATTTIQPPTTTATSTTTTSATTQAVMPTTTPNSTPTKLSKIPAASASLSSPKTSPFSKGTNISTNLAVSGTGNKSKSPRSGLRRPSLAKTASSESDGGGSKDKEKTSSAGIKDLSTSTALGNSPQPGTSGISLKGNTLSTKTALTISNRKKAGRLSMKLLKGALWGDADPTQGDTNQKSVKSKTTLDEEEKKKEQEAKEREEQKRLQAEAHEARQRLWREKENQERQAALEAIKYNAVQYTPDELAPFVETPTEITPYLYLGSWDCTAKRDKLKFKFGITHITNCSKQENRHGSHFIFQKFAISPNDPTSLLKPLDDFFAFVTKAAKEKGCVLVASDDGAGASLVIGWLMERRKLTFFEAFQHVYKRRYVITIAAGYIQQLLKFETRKHCSEKYTGKKEYFQCPCGKNQWILLSPLETTKHLTENPRPCRCGYYDSSLCPNIGCAIFCDEMAQKFPDSWKDTVVRWGYTVRDNVQGSFEYTEEHLPVFDLQPDQAKLCKKKAWTVYRCRKCRYLTHATAINNPVKWAVVTNINVTSREAHKRRLSL